MRRIITASLLFCQLSSSWAFQVQNGYIIDSQNQEIPIYGVNWFGFETSDHVVHGLWSRYWKDMIQQIKSLGFTAVRLPFCPGTLKGQTPQSIDYGKNPDLKDLDSLQIFDKMIAEFDRQGIYLLLDHHRPDCQTISNLWYTDHYSEQNWIDDLVWLATRYYDIPHFLGMDLKNEPHGNATWGTNDMATDWRLASQRAAAAIMAVNENVLIFVEGVQENSVCSSTINHWWGGNLEPVNCFPSEIPKNRLVFSPHVYGPDVYAQNYFDEANFPHNMTAIWDTHFGYLLKEGYSVIFGEFGGKYGHGGNEKDKIWQNALVDYMLATGITDFFYWSWNPNSGDTGGILQDDWTTIWDDKMALLTRLMTRATVNPPISESTPTTPVSPESETPSTPQDSQSQSTDSTPSPPSSTTTIEYQTLVNQGGCQVTYTVDNQWQDGMILRFFLNHQNITPIEGWRIQWTFPQPTQIINAWNVELTTDGNTVTVGNQAWNNTIYSNSPIEFGMQLQGQGLQPPAIATIFAAACDTPTAEYSPPTQTTGSGQSYEDGYQAGIALCQQNPLKCGIQINNNSTLIPDNQAQFQANTGRLVLPQVDIIDTQGKSHWQAEMVLINFNECSSLQEEILFKVTAVAPLSP